MQISNGADAVEMIMMIGFVVMGLSHIVRPKIWVEFFGQLYAMGTSGVVLRTFALEIWPAIVILAFHQVWQGPGIALTLYGWALSIKCLTSLLWPEIGLNSLALAQTGSKSFITSGVVLIALGASCAWALFG